jgi:hypothetical protein
MFIRAGEATGDDFKKMITNKKILITYLPSHKQSNGRQAGGAVKQASQMPQCSQLSNTADHNYTSVNLPA